jgi:fructose-1,6-bisphosphatase/inositol monophosphatase family enzyme
VVVSPSPYHSSSGATALEVARRCAEEGGRLAIRRFRRPQEVSVKGRGNLVTATDVDVERLIQDILAREYPQHAVLSEEEYTRANGGGMVNSAVADARGAAHGEWMWVVDPIDGTRNYVSGIPFFCVNVALCHHGEPVVAVTHDPVHGETFWAEKGAGTHLSSAGDGDRPCRASSKPSLQASVLAFDLGYDDERGAHMLKLLAELWPGMQSARIPGCAALGLAYAACGRYDLFVHHYLFPWDLAAGILLVRESGGVVTGRDGGPMRIDSEGVIAGGAAVHADFLRRAQTMPWRDEAPAAV